MISPLMASVGAVGAGLIGTMLFGDARPTLVQIITLALAFELVFRKGAEK
jgi:hypothetical protein